MSSRAPSSRAGLYALLALATLAVALVGYLGYVFYPRFDLPALSGATLLLLAAAAGVAAFFSPCSFPLLLSMLARPIASEREAESGRPVRQGMTFAAGLSVGASTFLVVVGLAIAAGADAFFGGITFTSTTGIAIRIAVGVLLIGLGLIQLNVLPISFRRFEPALHGYLGRQARVRRSRPFLGFTLFGFGYLLAGFGWTGPILVGLTGQALTVGGFLAAFVAFLVAAAAVVVLMFTLALLLVRAQERTSEAMRTGAPAIKRWGGRILVGVGVWFVVLGVFADEFAGVFSV